MTPADPSFAVHDVIIIVLLVCLIGEMFLYVMARRGPRRRTMCGWAARANRQSRTNKPHQPPRPEPERLEKPLPPGFAQLGGRRAKPNGLVVVKSKTPEPAP